MKTWSNTWRFDLPASLVVFLVAVPLSLGIAHASKAPIMAGLIAAVCGGILVGLFGGAPLQVSGPAAGLTVIVAGLVDQFKGDFRIVAAAVVVAGILQIVFGLCRVAHVAMAISPAVVHGMLAGIGIVITLAQLHVVLGGKPESEALHNLQELPAQIMNLHGPATIIGLLAFGIMVGWQYMPKQIKAVPSALVSVAVCTAIASFGNLDL
ncbi:MAG: SulP family inorganic anion transporter, partial [Fimbriimonadaceae bacterium]|nr:SulP family inorganic anion transporter [Fimbriimonadaceae bacterium]